VVKSRTINLGLGSAHFGQIQSVKHPVPSWIAWLKNLMMEQSLNLFDKIPNPAKPVAAQR
jgi:hypothetical protein